MELTNKTITVPEGYTIKRLFDGALLGREHKMGYLYYIDGKILDKPYMEQFGDFCEVKDIDIATDADFNKEVPVDESTSKPIVEEIKDDATPTKSLADILKEQIDKVNELYSQLQKQNDIIKELSKNK